MKRQDGTVLREKHRDPNPRSPADLHPLQHFPQDEVFTPTHTKTKGDCRNRELCKE